MVGGTTLVACAAATLGMLIAASGSAAAQDDVVRRVTVDGMAKVLQDSGYRAEIVRTEKRNYIRSGLSGRRVLIYFYDCNPEGCQSYQFSLIFSKNDKLTLERANEWNVQKRFAKAYVDSDGDMNFEWDVDLDGGVTATYLKRTLNTFETMVGQFDRFTD